MKDTICTIYRSSKESELYLYVEKSVGLEQIPEELLKRMGKTSAVMTMMITPGKKLARVSAKNVLEDIESKGFFLQLPPVFNPQVTYGE